MSDRTVNIPLLRKAVEWAEAEATKPYELSEWYQAAWMVTPDDFAEEFEPLGVEKSQDCGTCYCIAGYVAALAGKAVPDYTSEVVAAATLGLTAPQASLLFDGMNTIEDVRRIAEDIAGERL